MNIKPRILLSFIFFLGISLDVTSQDTITLYLDNDFVSIEVENAKFIREVIIANNHYFVTDTDINGKMVNYGEYNSVNPWIEDGLSIHYNNEGNKYSSGLYLEGKLTGNWIYYINSKEDTVNYDIDLSEFQTVDCNKLNTVKKKKKLKQVGAIHVDSITSYINKNFHFPARIKSQTEKFNQVINLVVDVDGKVRCPKIVNFIDNDLSLELLRILLQYRSEIDVITPIPLSLTIDINEGSTMSVKDRMPVFKGGMKQLYEYINLNVTYTDKAMKEKASGKVLVSFWIESDGSITNPIITRGIHHDLDSISLVLIENMPNWIPGYQKGSPQRVKYNLPITFDLDKFKKSRK
jgi:TonB family protein